MNRLPRNENNYYTDYDIRMHPDATQSRVLTYASFYVVDNFLDVEEVDALADYLGGFDKKQSFGSVLGHDSEASKEYNIRDSSIYFLKPEDRGYTKWDDMITERALEINKNIFNLHLTTSMWPQYTSYGPKQHFNWHPDGPFGIMDSRGLNMVPKNLAWRKLSMTLALNSPEEYEGGDFQIINGSANPECHAINTIRLDKGSAVLFPAFASHRVTPVKSGKRRSLVYWFCGPRWR
jgi:PKHD-type hydroxylase